jgi:hypothetical protein
MKFSLAVMFIIILAFVGTGLILHWGDKPVQLTRLEPRSTTTGARQIRSFRFRLHLPRLMLRTWR